MWKVLAYGAETGSLFIYSVDAPESSNSEDVVTCAYAKHGMAYRNGDVPEYLGPRYNAEWIDKENDA